MVRTEKQLRKRIKAWILFFIVGLVLSGITAFPLQWEMKLLQQYLPLFPGFMEDWLNNICKGVNETGDKYPFLFYGTDWLAFAHLMIAVAFIGPLRDPVRNIWVIQFGMIACLMILPLAFICGPIRQIPFYHQLIDCTFGVIGIIPLYLCFKDIRTLEKITNQ